MWSCVNGHANSPGAEYCATCGARVETGVSADRLYGGSPGTEYASDYASGSFAEYIDRLAGDARQSGFPGRIIPGRAGAPSAAMPPAPAARPAPAMPLAPAPARPAARRTRADAGERFLSRAQRAAAAPGPGGRPAAARRRYSGYPGWPDDTGQPDDIVEDEQSAGRGWYDDGPATKPGPVLTGERAG